MFRIVSMLVSCGADLNVPDKVSTVMTINEAPILTTYLYYFVVWKDRTDVCIGSRAGGYYGSSARPWSAGESRRSGVFGLELYALPLHCTIHLPLLSVLERLDGVVVGSAKDKSGCDSHAASI